MEPDQDEPIRQVDTSGSLTFTDLQACIRELGRIPPFEFAQMFAPPRAATALQTKMLHDWHRVMLDQERLNLEYQFMRGLRIRALPWSVFYRAPKLKGRRARRQWRHERRQMQARYRHWLEEMDGQVLFMSPPPAPSKLYLLGESLR